MESKDSVGGTYALTPLQQALLVESARDGEAGTNVEQVLGWFDENLDGNGFRRACERVVQRHEVLRTVLRLGKEGLGVGEIQGDLPLEWENLDWREASNADADARLKHWLQEDRRRGFVLDAAPPSRFTLIRLGVCRTLWVWTVHHALVDGRSMAQVVREILEAYDGIQAGVEPEVPAVCGFSVFAERLRKASGDGDREGWISALEGVRSASPIPMGKPGQESAEIWGPHATVSRRLGREAMDGIAAWAADNGLNVHTLVQAAWALVLARYTGSAETIFGETVSVRPRDDAGAERVAGPFIETLPVRVRVIPEVRVLDWLRDIREHWRSARRRQPASLTQIQSWLGGQGDAALFQTLVVFENRTEMALGSVGGVKDGKSRRFELVERCGFPLSLSVLHGEGLESSVEYDSGRYEAAFVERLLRDWELALTEFRRNADRRLGDVVLRDRVEWERVRGWLCGTKLEVPDGTLLDAFDAVVRRFPDGIAVEHDGRRLSYRELRAASESLAGTLRALGLGAERRVILVADRSLALVVGLLGILRAGGSVVPLDPDLPPARTAAIIEDSVPWGFCIADDAPDPCPASSLPKIQIGTFLGGEGRENDTPGKRAIRGPFHEACVLYTSGSTGKPKGVILEHGALASYLVSAAEDLGLGQGDRVLQFASPVFDVCLEEVFVTLLRGATLVVRPRAWQGTVQGFLAFCLEQNLTVLDLPTAFWHEWMGEWERTACSWPDTVRVVLIGGEAARAAALAVWHRRVPPGVRLINAYGPAEATIAATWAELTGHQDRAATGIVPIGRPRPGIDAWVVDPWDEPTPIGVPGELLLGGPQLARGYVGPEELSAQRFVRLGKDWVRDQRLYRTGDIVRVLEDGQLQFLGRRDEQLKVRGHRVETGEIEAVLSKHPAILEAAIVARDHPARGWELVAHVVPAAGMEISIDAVRTALREHLPEAMVPSAFVLWDRLPRTPSEKLDRQAMKLSARTELRAAGAGEAPRTVTERRLAPLWSRLLGLSEVGRGSDFFEAGGHSLLAMQLSAEVSREWGLRLAYPTLLRHRTLASLASWLETQRAGVREVIPRAPRAGTFRVSREQERLWVLQHRLPDPATYHVPLRLRVTGLLDLEQLDRSLALLAARHGLLRVRIRESGGYPVLEELPERAGYLKVLDWRAVAGVERSNRLAAEVDREFRRSLSGTTEPLWRARAIRLSETETELLVTFHHLICDEWSVRLWVQEWEQIHAAGGSDPGLPELPIQYADYAAWQREYLERPERQADREYWREALRGADFAIPFPEPMPDAGEGPGRVGSLTWPGPAEMRVAVETLARKTGATPGVVMMAALGSLLARFAGQDDLIVGMPLAHRDRPEVQGMFGFLLNLVPIRIRAGRERTFRELVEQVQGSVSGAVEHGILPLDAILEEAARNHPERSVDSEIRVAMVWLDPPPVAPRWGEARSEWIPVQPLAARFDLTLFAAWLPDGRWELTWEYDTRRFDSGTLSRLAEQFASLLVSGMGNPEGKLGALEWVPADQSRQVLEWSCGGRSGEPTVTTLTARFREVVRQFPDGEAVRDGETSLSYAAVDRISSGIAMVLRTQGLSMGESVGVDLERSAEGILAALGILKAGGVYLPLPRRHPADRLRRMLGDSRTRWVVGDANSVPALLPDGVRFLRIGELLNELECSSSGSRWDPEEPRIGGVPGTRGVVGGEAIPATGSLGSHDSMRAWAAESSRATAPAGDRSIHGGDSDENLPDSPACVMFTSGSTGEPKGVLVPHRSVVRLVMGTDFVDWGPARRILAVASTAFDASLFEIWGAFLHGGTCVVHPEAIPTPEGLGESIQEGRADCVLLTAALFNEVLDRCPEVLRPIRYLVTGGEAMSLAHARRALEALPETRIVNAYGPTEGGVIATAYPLPRGGVLDSCTSVPLGRPLAHTRCHVLDEQLRPVPPGVAGELCIGGEGVALGYLHRPELTEDRFRPDPYGNKVGSRLYRTGDRARFRSDGSLEFLGRLDDQLKIRGFRVEPGEIESALEEHAEVARVCVVVRGSSDVDRRLVACVVAKGGGNLDAGDLRAHLAMRLPEYMIPARYTFLSDLPRTAHGKVDRRALQRLETEEVAAGRPYEPPTTATETAIASIWGELLRLDRVGRRDDFFMLGGHSLMAMQVLARLRQRFASDVGLALLFQARTLEALASEVDRREGERLRDRLEGDRSDVELPHPLSYAQARLWFLHQLNPEDPAYHLPFSIRFWGCVDEADLRGAVEDVVRRHGALRTSFQSGDLQPTQTVHREVVVPWETVDGEGATPEAREAWLLRETEAWVRRPMDLGLAPLMRVRWVRWAPEESMLQITLHHLVSDGWSVGVFLKELQAFYALRQQGVRTSPEPLAFDYPDYARAQREWLVGERLEERLAYWRERLQGAPLRLELPRDGKPGGGPVWESGDGAMLRVLSVEDTAALMAWSRQEGATPFMVILAAWGTLLGRLAGMDDVVVGTPVAARDRVEWEDVIGLFLNTLALRVRRRTGDSLAGLVKRVREETVLDLAHQDLPFEKLVEVLRPERSTEHTPVFQVLLNYAPMELEPQDRWAGQVRTEVVFPRPADAKFDLTLYVRPRAAGMEFELVPRRDLFSRERAEGMLEQLIGLLRQGMAAPKRPLDELSLVIPAHREWMADPTQPLEVHPFPTVPDAFEAQARQWGDRVAVECEGRKWSYSELEDRSRAIAWALLQSGITAGDVVAVCGDRSFGLVAGLLGVLRAGAVLLPLDPHLPQARQQRMIETSGMRACVSVGSQGGAPWRNGAAASCLEIPVEAETGRILSTQAVGSTEPLPRVREDAPAYLFFTSGTTGVPKAVRGVHRGLAHFLHWQKETFGIGPGDRAAQITGLSFDVVLRDVFTPLTAGATLVLPADPATVVSNAMIPWLERHGCTLFHAVPSLVETWLQGSGEEPKLEKLRWAFLAGEPLHEGLVRRWRARVGTHGCIVNLYGPTETTLAKCWHPVDEEPTPGVQPVGRALPGTQVWVLDSAGRLCGAGESGEIVIRTPYRTLGYLNPTDEDQRRFVPNPSRADVDPADIVYRTGDLGRFRPDGALEILGRRDDQVKIRGVRVELGEVVTALESDARVRSAVVLVRESAHGAKELVGFVSASEAAPDLERSVRSRLIGGLPAAAVPSRIHVLERLPLTPNGKVDRAALLAWASERERAEHKVGASFATPGAITERQERLRQIWAELLSWPEVGIHDDFFESGGHSLLALQLVSRVRQTLGVSLNLRSVFDSRTIAELDALLGQAEQAGGQEPGPRRRFRGASKGVPLFEVPGYFGLGYLRPSIASAIAEIAPYYDGLRYAGAEDNAPPMDSIEAIAGHLVKQIGELWPLGTGPLCLCGFSFGGTVAFEVARQLVAQGQPVERLLLYDSRLGDGHRVRSNAEVLVELLRRARQQPRGQRAGFLVRMLREKIRSFFRSDPIDEAMREASIEPLNGAGEGPEGWAKELPGDVAPELGTTGLLKESVRIASALAGERYRPRPYAGRVTLFKAKHLVANEWIRRELDALNGWGPYVVGDIETVLVPREHLGIYTEPLHPLVIRRTVEILREANRHCLGE